MAWDILDYEGRIVGDGAQNSTPLQGNSWQNVYGVVLCDNVIDCDEVVIC